MIETKAPGGGALECGVSITVLADQRSILPEQYRPNIRALRARLERRLEVRLSRGRMRCSCGHSVEVGCTFVIDWDDDRVPISYCAACATAMLRARLSLSDP